METLTKVCSKCKEEKLLNEFNKRIRNKDGLSGACKNCNNSRLKKYREENKEKVKMWEQKGRIKNKENIKKLRAKNYVKNREKKLRYAKGYRELHKQEINRKRLLWYKNNPEKVNNLYFGYRNKNKEKIKKYNSIYRKELPKAEIISRLKREGYPENLLENENLINLKRIIIKGKREANEQLKTK